MNTPTHIIASLAALRTKDNSEFNKSIIWGAIIPDSVIYIFFVWEGIIMGNDQRTLWDELYFTDFWQYAVDIFNSFPIVLGLLAVSYLIKKKWLQYLSWSMLIHLALDVLVHNDDAHAHFLPFTDWKYISPISYWDPEHYGDILSAFEAVLFIVLSVMLYRNLTSKLGKRSLILLSGIWTALGVSVLIFFMFNQPFG